MTAWRVRGAAALLGCLLGFSAPAAAQPLQPEAYPTLVAALEAAVLAGDRQAYLSLIAADADQDAARAFTETSLPTGVDRVTIVPRFQLPIEDVPLSEGVALTLEVFAESGNQGRLETWMLELGRADLEAPWAIRTQTIIDSVDDLRHLRLDPTKQYAADNIVVLGEDLSLTLSGTAFAAETDEGITGLVLVGDGLMSFAPRPEAEQGQVRIFSGDDRLETEFDAVFIRVHPEVFSSRVSTSSLIEQTVDPRTLEEATRVFEEFIGLSFTLDLSHISDRLWSVSPSVGDFLAEIKTRRHGTLTYAQSAQQPEDISLSVRETNRIVSLYPSARKRATQSRYFSDDEASLLDILDYDITASFEPLGFSQQDIRARPELIGCRIVGATRLAVRVKSLPIAAFSLRLADELTVSSITSNEFGPLLFFRLAGQNNVVVHLPTEVRPGTEFTITVSYAGDLPAQELDENWLASQYFFFEAEGVFGLGEPRYVYSNRSYWYPQGRFSDYATATMNLSVPAGWGVVASGDPLPDNPPVTEGADRAPRSYSFVALQPARYLSALISRFEEHEVPTSHIRLPAADAGRPETTTGGVYYDTLTLRTVGSPRSMRAVADTTERAADIAGFYAQLLGDLPYPSLTVALTDNQLPGGHSPSYFAIMNHELPRNPGVMVSWQTDPVSFSSYPAFFLAHEIAHQWWGQAIGWKNYHEQWLSEGLAQYFAALYAERDGGPEAFGDILRQMRRWALRHSDEGPISLGYRLGHLDGEPRIFRALVYNKGAMVLHTLRGLIGDEAFFAGLRRFYHEWRFRKAGTDALQQAFETEAGRPLDRFFERWIHESALPHLSFTSRTETGPDGEDVVLRFEQETDRLFELPVTVELTYRNDDVETVVVPVVEEVTEVRVPTEGRRLRRVRVNRDEVALAEIDR